MSRLLDPEIESRTDRLMVGAIVAMVAIALFGAAAAERDVPLQIDREGFTSFVPPLVAAIVFPAGALLTRAVTLRSVAPWARWLGRVLIAFFLLFEIAAFLHSS